MIESCIDMINDIRLFRQNLDFIKEELEVNKPYEACGVLIGSIKGCTAQVDKAIPINNARQSKNSFELDSVQFYNAWNNAQKIKKEIVGIYHTHPFYTAVPSLWDRETMENTELVWLIVGAYGVKAYIWINGIKHVKIVIYRKMNNI